MVSSVPFPPPAGLNQTYYEFILHDDTKHISVTVKKQEAHILPHCADTVPVL
jgi:hypothetical protein